MDDVLIRAGQLSFRVESLDGVKAFYALLKDRTDVSEIRPVSHGNAWSVYFRDPENNRLEVFTDSSATQRLAGAKDASDILVGPAKATYDSGPLKAGTYFFRCDVHPTQMTGTFVVG